MVSSEDEEVFGVFDLVREEEADSFEGLLSSIDVVAEEEVVGFRGETAILEKPQEVVILPMDVAFAIGERRISVRGSSGKAVKTQKREHTANLNGCFQLEKDGLVNEDFPGLRAEILDFVFLELNGFSGSVTSHWKNSSNMSALLPHATRPTQQQQ